jgi:hypothetical protein
MRRHWTLRKKSGRLKPAGLEERRLLSIRIDEVYRAKNCSMVCGRATKIAAKISTRSSRKFFREI